MLVLPDPPSPPPVTAGGGVIGDAVVSPESARLLRRLDRYEGLGARPAEYVRVSLPVRLVASGRVVEAWAYVCPADGVAEVLRGARRILSGDWSRR